MPFEYVELLSPLNLQDSEQEFALDHRGWDHRGWHNLPLQNGTPQSIRREKMWIEGVLGLLMVLILNSMMEETIREKIWIEGLLVVVLILVLVLRYNEAKKKKRGFPPGPFAWPIIGHLHLFWKLPHQNLRDASKRHGHVLGLRLGQQRAVVVSSPELAKLVLLTHDKLFADRPPHAFTSDLLFGSTNGVAFTRYGPQWRKHRKLCALHLFTAKRLQELQYVRQQEMRALLLSIHHQSAPSAGSASGAGLDIGRCMGQMSSRLVLRLLQSKAMTQVGDEHLQLLMREVEQEFGPTLGDLIPSLSWLDFLRKRRMRRIHARLDKIYTAMIREHKESAGQHTDLLDALLSQEEPLNMDEIKGIISDLIGAGIHTTALTLEWAMAELLRNPCCLHRLRREIDTQLGTNKKLISDEDLPNLSYLKCVIKELFRLHPVVPLLITRFSQEECQVQGYTIPAETLVFVNVWAIGRDEQVWPNAKEFMPERFENTDIDLKGQHFELLPFGSGRRICVGLPLALSVIETTLANLVSWFDWALPDGEAFTSINMDEKTGLAANKATPVIAIPKPRESLSTLSDM